MVELFAGINVARHAADRLKWRVAAHFVSEIDDDAWVVTQKNFPDAINLGRIEHISDEQFVSLLAEYEDCLIVVTFGPPCQDVSLANAGGEGAGGSRSCLRDESSRLTDIIMMKSSDAYRWQYAPVYGSQ